MNSYPNEGAGDAHIFRAFLREGKVCVLLTQLADLLNDLLSENIFVHWLITRHPTLN